MALSASCAHVRVQPRLSLADITAGRAGTGPQLAGLAVVVTDADKDLRAEAFGLAVIGPDRAMTVDTPVRVASVSKLITTLGILRLVDAGTLDLDRDVSVYLGRQLRNPAFPLTPITLRLLLSHQSSITDGGGYFWPLGTRLRDGMTMANWEAAQPPGRFFSYANLNYGIAAEVMEAATGERFDKLMTRLVFEPLKMDACYNWSGCSAAAISSAAVLYRKGADETAWAPTGPWVAQIDDLRGVAPLCPVRISAPDASCDLRGYVPGSNGTLFSPQGGVRISARDLARVARLLLNEGELDGVRFLAPSTIQTMMTPQWQTGETPSGETYGGLMRCWGLSIQCLTGDVVGQDQPLFPGRSRWWGHLGDAYGAWTGIWIDPVRGRGYVYIVTGTADDPAKSPGRHSQFHSYEEAILSELAR